MIDKEIILHVIDGPGAGWVWMFIAVIAAMFFSYLVKSMNGYEDGFREGRACERREGLDQLRAQIAKISFEQQQIINKRAPPDDQ